MSNAQTNGKSLSVNSDINNNTDEANNASPTLAFNEAMLSYASTMSIVLSIGTYSNNGNHSMDDVETQVFTGHSKAINVLATITQKSLDCKANDYDRHWSYKYRITCVKQDGRQNYEVRDMSTLMSLVALEVGSMLTHSNKGLDSWWKEARHVTHSHMLIENFRLALGEVEQFLSKQNEKKEGNNA